jgi:hypothetical protein
VHVGRDANPPAPGRGAARKVVRAGCLVRLIPPGRLHAGETAVHLGRQTATVGSVGRVSVHLGAGSPELCLGLVRDCLLASVGALEHLVEPPEHRMPQQQDAQPKVVSPALVRAVAAARVAALTEVAQRLASPRVRSRLDLVESVSGQAQRLPAAQVSVPVPRQPEPALASGRAPRVWVRLARVPEQQPAVQARGAPEPGLPVSLRPARPVLVAAVRLALWPASSARLLPPRPSRLSPAWPTPQQRLRHPQLP